MPIATNQELYDLVRETVSILHDAGEPKLAKDLHGALSISSLPGEILGEIRLALQRIRSWPVYERLDVRRRVNDGIDYVDRVLG